MFMESAKAASCIEWLLMSVRISQQRLCVIHYQSFIDAININSRDS